MESGFIVIVLRVGRRGLKRRICALHLVYGERVRTHEDDRATLGLIFRK
jgi:hypothetical protein